MEAYEPEYLKIWTMPKDYFGAEWPGFYGSGIGRSRDSDALERANFQAMLNALGFDSHGNPPESTYTLPDEEPTRTIVRANHWAVGWIEWIAIHESDAAGLRIADELMERMKDYPVLDDELFSQFEDEDCSATWANCYDPRERLAYLRKHLYKTDGVFRDALAACRGDWGAAAQLLPCPSDLIA